MAVSLSSDLAAPLRHELQCMIVANTTTSQSYRYRSSNASSTFAKPPKQRKGLKTTVTALSRILRVAKRMTDVVAKCAAEKPRIAVAEAGRTEASRKSSLAEEKAHSPVVLQVEPASPISALSPLSESIGSYHDAGSPLSPLSSLGDFDMPPTPRLRTRELPMSPSIIVSPLCPLPPLQSGSPARPEDATQPEVAEFDPFNDDPLLHPLAEDWSSLDRNASLSLTAEPPEEEPWPYNNALGLYVDPAINVAAWDAGGFIRSTAPSPSPTRFQRHRQRVNLRSRFG